MKSVYVPKDPHEKAMQRALMQYRRPENYALVEEALKKAGREDLIGFGPKCLIRPRKGSAPSAKPAPPALPHRKSRLCRELRGLTGNSALFC